MEETIWKHVKTGGLYKILGECQIEATNTLAVRYQDTQHAGPEWVRPKDEFFDGRFIKIKKNKININYIHWAWL